MKRILCVAILLSCTGCGRWLGQYEPGVRFRINPITKSLEFENTTDTSVTWGLFHGTFGDDEIWIEDFEAEHSACQPPASNLQPPEANDPLNLEP